jgi:AraC family transcriptional regulator
MNVEFAKGVRGNILKSCEVNGFRLTETIYKPNQSLPKHSHQHAYFCFVLHGAYTEIREKKILECKPLTLLFHASGEAHSDSFGAKGGRCFNVEIAARWIKRLGDDSVRLDAPSFFRGGFLPQLAIRLNREFHRTDDASRLAIEGLTLEMIAETSRGSVKNINQHAPRWLEQVKEILHARLSDSLTHSEIATLVGVHPVHVARQFRKHYGCTIGNYIRQLKIEFACQQISTSDSSLSEIALAAGFFDQSHFTRTFKRYSGMSPAEYQSFVRSR